MEQRHRSGHICAISGGQHGQEWNGRLGESVSVCELTVLPSPDTQAISCLTHRALQNLDIEVTDTAAQAKSMVALTKKFTKALHEAVPGCQVSFDTDSLAAPCSSYPASADRYYDVAALADAVDFLVVMDCAL